MYTRKQQMQKIDELEKKIEMISRQVSSDVDNYLTSQIAQVININKCMIDTLHDVFNDKQKTDFFSVMNQKMSEIKED